MNLKHGLLWTLLIAVGGIYALSLPYVIWYSSVLFYPISDNVSVLGMIRTTFYGFLWILGYSGSFLLIAGSIFYIGSSTDEKPQVIRTFKWLLLIDLIVCAIIFGTQLTININDAREAKALQKFVWNGKEIYIEKEFSDLPSDYQLDVQLSEDLSNDKEGFLYITKKTGMITKADIGMILTATKGLNQVIEVGLHKNESVVNFIINEKNHIHSCTISNQGDEKDMDPSVCATD